MTRVATFVVSLALLAAGAVVPWVRSAAERTPPVRRYETLILASPLNHIAVIGDSYTAGAAEGGRGPEGWTEQAWQQLARAGVNIAADVASEGGAGYATRGNHGSIFRDLTSRAVHPDDQLVVFFGSRNDQDVEPWQLSWMVHDTFGLARQMSPGSGLLVIGPAWPTVDVPGNVLRIRDILNTEARIVGAEFVDPIAEGWFVGHPELIGADGVHPTDGGHTYMADKIAPLIRGRLPRTT